MMTHLQPLEKQEKERLISRFTIFSHKWHKNIWSYLHNIVYFFFCKVASRNTNITVFFNNISFITICKQRKLLKNLFQWKNKNKFLLLTQRRWKAVSLKSTRSAVSAYSKKRQPLSQSSTKAVSCTILSMNFFLEIHIKYINSTV